MSNIIITLTEDQRDLAIRLIDDHIIYNPVKQPSLYLGQRTKNALLGQPNKQLVDHSSSERMINEKIASGKLRLPIVSKT